MLELTHFKSYEIVIDKAGHKETLSVGDRLTHKLSGRVLTVTDIANITETGPYIWVELVDEKGLITRFNYDSIAYLLAAMLYVHSKFSH